MQEKHQNGGGGVGGGTVGFSLVSRGTEEPPETLGLKSTSEPEVSRCSIVWEKEKGLKCPHGSHFTDG